MAVGEFFVVEAEAVEDSGLEVVDVDRVFFDPHAELVGLAHDLPAFDAAAGQPEGIGKRMVTAQFSLSFFSNSA